jgi:transcriptional regulator with XRE-family HTH domain
MIDLGSNARLPGDYVAGHALGASCTLSALAPRIGDHNQIARKAKSEPQKTGLYHVREARGVSRTEGISKQQLSRLENGLIRLWLDHLKSFANVLCYRLSKPLSRHFRRSVPK